MTLILITVMILFVMRIFFIIKTLIKRNLKKGNYKGRYVITILRGEVNKSYHLERVKLAKPKEFK